MRHLLKIAVVLNFPATLILAVLIAMQIQGQTKLQEDLGNINRAVSDLEIIASKSASSSAETLIDSIDDLRVDIIELKAIGRSDNLTSEITGRIAGISQTGDLYPKGVQGYVALNTDKFPSAEIVADRAQPNSAITTITDATPLPYSFKANGWYLVTLSGKDGWIKSSYVTDVTVQVVTTHE